MKQKVIIYMRVSTIIQDNSRQKEELKRFCQAMDYEIVQEIEENISGMVPWKERKLSSVFNLDNINGVIILELSRFGRDAEDVLSGIKLLHEKGIWLYSKNNNIKTLDDHGKEDLTGKLTLTILSGVAEMERSLTRQRSVSGLIKNVNDGNWTGGKFLPYGYKRVDKKLVIEETESLVIKEIFKKYLEEGYGTKLIAKYLNSNIKTPTRYNLVVEDKVKKYNKWKLKDDEIEYKEGKDFEWKDGTIYSILTNKVYIGEKEGKGILNNIILKSPPIIEKEVFLKVQHKLKNTQKKTSTKYIYVLEGKPKCGVCNSSYFPHKRSSNKDNTYKCLSKRYGNSCDNYGIGIPKLNAGVWTTLRKDRSELENILMINKNKTEIQNEIIVLTEKNKQIEIEINQYEKKQKEILNLFLEGKIEKQNLYKIDEDIKSKLKSLKEELEMLNSELYNKKNFIKNQQSANNSLRDIKENINILKRTFEKVIQKVVIYPVKENKIKDIFQNKQDNLVYVELFTFINISKPLSFVISQRSIKYLFITENIKFDKEKKSLYIEEVEEEEEEFEFIYKDLMLIDSLQNSQLVTK
jgi:site-specific DNA recombinase